MHATVTGPTFDGFVSIETKGKQLSLRFTLAALAKLQDELGGDFVTLSSRALDETKLEDLARLAAVGAGSDYDIAEIYGMGLPIVPLRDAVTRAWQHAFFGGILPAEEAKGPVKKMIARLSTYWRNLWKRG